MSRADIQLITQQLQTKQIYKSLRNENYEYYDQGPAVFAVHLYKSYINKVELKWF